MIATIVILAVLVLAVGLAVRHIVKTKKAGGCVGCPGGADCGCNCAESKPK